MTPHRSDPLRQAEAELEALYRIEAVRSVLDAFLAGHWELDSELLLLACAVLDQAGAWAMLAEEAARAAGWQAA